MIRIITFDQIEEWDKIVVSFKSHDVYYLHGYVDSFMRHGDGDPILIYYESSLLRGMYVAMKRDLSLLPFAISRIRPDMWFDLATPYGYGGWVLEGEVCPDQLRQFIGEYREYMFNHNYVSNFVRYSPVLKNADVMRPISRVIDLGKTISIDLSNEELIWNNIKSKNRNMIRKAMRNGVRIEHSKPTHELMIEFKQIYDETMINDNANDYYFFNDSFYQSIIDNLKDNTEVFYAKLDDGIIAISIILYANGLMHYHLSGTISAYRKLAPTNLLLYEAAIWGCKNGFKQFHLGGGVGSGEDDLYKFKAAFNRVSNCQFSIGQEIFNKNMYNQLLLWRQKDDSKINVSSGFFPIYRQNIADNTVASNRKCFLNGRKIAIYGAGGLGREVAGGIQRINNAGRQQWEIVGFFDDNIAVGTQVSHYGKVLGGINELNAYGEPLALAIAVGAPMTRKKIHERISNPNISFPNLIAPSFRILDRQTFDIGEGNIIQDNCSVTCDVKLGNFNVFNGSNAMGHDVVVGDFNVLMPGVRLSGEVTVGNCNLLGVDSVVLQRVKIGDKVTLGAGSVMMTKPRDGFTYIGIPAKKFDFE